VKCNVPVAEATQDEAVLPERVQEALGQLMGAAREGLLALSVEVGLGVLRELLEAEVEEIVGPKGRWNGARTAVRHGHENGEVTLGGRRVPVKRPRARSALRPHALQPVARRRRRLRTAAAGAVGADPSRSGRVRAGALDGWNGSTRWPGRGRGTY